MKKLMMFLLSAVMLASCGTAGPAKSESSTASAMESTSNSGTAETTSSNGTAETTTGSSESAQTGILNANSNIADIAVGLVADMSAGDFKRAMTGYSYDEKMKSVISETLLKDQVWGILVNTYGKFKEITGSSASKVQVYDVIAVKVTFEKQKLLVNIVFDADKLIAGINYAPDPGTQVQTIPSGITETTIGFGKSGFELPGTLTTPTANGPFPILILVHGSGPNDRDETIGPNKPFRDIAWSLAEKGIATLRYDKRTLVYQKEIASATSITVFDETVEDAVLAMEYIKSNPLIDPQKMYFLGHSLGGNLMPRIAALTPDAVGYIILAGSVTPLEDIIVEQINYLSNLDGTVTAEEKQGIASYEKMRDTIKSLTSDSKETTAQMMGVPLSYWLDLMDYKPTDVAKKIQKPLLILQGERDYQVTMKEFNLWKDALKDKNNVTFKSYPGMNHLFIYGTEPSNPKEYESPGAFDKKVIEDIANWISSSE
jgi:dienelactone hydrolase